MLKRTCVQCGKEFEMNQSEINFYKKKKLSLPKRCKECRELNKAKKKKNYQLQEEDERAAQKIEKNDGKSKKNKSDNQSDYKKNNQSNDKTSNQSDYTKQASGAENNKKEKKMSTGKKRLAYIVAAAIIALGGGGTAISTLNDAPAEDVKVEQTVEMEDTTATVEIDLEEADEVQQAAGQDKNSETTYVDAEEKEDESEGLTEVVMEYEFRNDELFENHYKKHGIEMDFDSAEEYLAGANRVIASPDVLHKKEAEDGDDVYYLEETNEFVVVSKAGYIRTYFNPSDGIDYYNRQ